MWPFFLFVRSQVRRAPVIAALIWNGKQLRAAQLVPGRGTRPYILVASSPAHLVGIGRSAAVFKYPGYY